MYIQCTPTTPTAPCAVRSLKDSKADAAEIAAAVAQLQTAKDEIEKLVRAGLGYSLDEESTGKARVFERGMCGISINRYLCRCFFVRQYGATSSQCLIFVARFCVFQ